MLNYNMLNPSVMEQGGPAALQGVESQEQQYRQGEWLNPVCSYPCPGISFQDY